MGAVLSNCARLAIVSLWWFGERSSLTKLKQNCDDLQVNTVLYLATVLNSQCCMYTVVRGAVISNETRTQLRTVDVSARLLDKPLVSPQAMAANKLKYYCVS